MCSQLCLHGHTSCFPAVDFGIDLMLDNGLKIQVKVAFSAPTPDINRESTVLTLERPLVPWAIR